MLNFSISIQIKSRVYRFAEEFRKVISWRRLTVIAILTYRHESMIGNHRQNCQYANIHYYLKEQTKSSGRVKNSVTA